MLQLAAIALTALPYMPSTGLLPECCGSSCGNCCECPVQPLATTIKMSPAPTPALIAACNSSCFRAPTTACAAWQVILATKSSGKKDPICSLFPTYNGSRSDANMISSLRVPPPPAPTPAPPPRRAAVNFACSDAALSAGFEWAKTTALNYVQTGKQPTFMPCYWAGYPNREAFYLRDFAHQTVGAHLLGLDEENFAMASLMARSVTAERGYYPVWSYNFDGSIFSMDYHRSVVFL